MTKNLGVVPLSKAVPWCIGAVAILLYAESVGSPFQYDDWFTIVEPAGDWALAGPIQPVEPERLRPVTTASRALDRAWNALRPEAAQPWPAFGFHLNSVFLHAVASVLVWWVARLWWSDPLVAAAAGLLFAVHPFNAEAANYLSARASVLAACSELTALGTYTLWRRGRGRAWWVASLLSAVVALGAKESAVTLPALMWLAEAKAIAPAEGWRDRAVRLWPWLSLAAAYAAARVSLPSDVVGGLEYSAGARGAALATGLAIVWRAAADFWWPRSLSVEHGIETVRGVAAWGAIGLTALAAAWAGWGWRRGAMQRDVMGALLFGCAWWFAAALPALTLPFITHVALYLENRYYLAGVGFAILGGVLAAQGGRALAARVGVVMPALAGAALVIGLAVASHGRTEVWKSEVALWQDATGKAPRSALAHAMLGAAYLDRDQPDLALAPLERAVRLDPAYPLAAMNLGAAYARLGRWNEAMLWSRRALAIAPDYHQARRNLAVAYEALQRWDEAIVEYKALAQYGGEDDELRLRLGALAFRAGRLDEAEASFQAVLGREPTSYPALFNLGLVEERRGRPERAEGYFRRALAANSADPDVHYRLGALAAAAGRRDEAIASFERALGLNPAHFVTHFDLARLLDASGRREDAAAHYRRFLDAVPQNSEWASARQHALARLGMSDGAALPAAAGPRPR